MVVLYENAAEEKIQWWNFYNGFMLLLGVISYFWIDSFITYYE